MHVFCSVKYPKTQSLLLIFTIAAEEMLKLMKITGRFPNGEKKKRPPRSQILYYEEVPAGEQSGVEVLRPLKF